ncbi:RsmF rRNA methyltransferase first C-terminal domain-containing protein [Paenibacillus larvae]
MMEQLPSSYIRQMKELLKEESEAFLNSYTEQRTFGLRLNPLNIRKSQKERTGELVSLFGLTSVPWCPTGYYYKEETRPGKHPYHAAGLYYLQEPSAMSAAEILNPEPGDIVLDLAAAPGGKSSQIAGKLLGRGLLVANEIHPGRAKILAENIERMGAGNVLVANASPQQLAEKLPLFFDKIIVDAPCSGEGMFRKDPEAIKEWSPEHVQMCAARQMDILPDAIRMLKPGGLLVYSTCTFNQEENEGTIRALLADYPEMRLISEERIWPHLQKGEGHYVALLAKEEGSIRVTGEPEKSRRGGRNKTGKSSRNREEAEALQYFETFRKQFLPGYILPEGSPVRFGDQLYWMPQAKEGMIPDMLNGLKVLRPGLHLGEMKKNRFEPSHALALAVSAGQAALALDLKPEDPMVQAYLRGEALYTGRSLSGWTLVCVNGFPLGWGKENQGQLNNRYPKGLRRFA